MVSDSSAVTHKYDYDALGVEKNPDPLDANPFRYCGEYYDGETKTYYLRARYYDPNIGRFTQQDTHWNTANSIYGDNPQKINEREDKLGLKSYSYAPQITAVMQSGNLYVCGVSNPVVYVDSSGSKSAMEIYRFSLRTNSSLVSSPFSHFSFSCCISLLHAANASCEILPARIHAKRRLYSRR